LESKTALQAEKQKCQDALAEVDRLKQKRNETELKELLESKTALQAEKQKCQDALAEVDRLKRKVDCFKRQKTLLKLHACNADALMAKLRDCDDFVGNVSADWESRQQLVTALVGTTEFKAVADALHTCKAHLDDAVSVMTGAELD
jgi:hypothetical protein